MRKIYSFTLLSVMTALTATASVDARGVNGQMLSGNAPVNVKDAAESKIRPLVPGSFKVPENGWQVQLEEDFSKMKAGTAEEHDGEHLIVAEDYSIPEDYVHTAGWTAYGIYQAGGACAVDYPQYGGFINTPAAVMPGLVRVSFRLKGLDEIRAVSVVLSKGSIGQPQQVAPNQTPRLFFEDGWQEYEYYFECRETEPVFVQFNCRYYNADGKGFVIDDLKVESNSDYLSPVAEMASALFTNDGFSVRWTPAEEADGYLVSLYEEKTMGDADVELSWDFDGWTTEGGALPDDTEGLEFVKMYPNHPAVVDYNGGKAIALGHHDEIIELPTNGGRFRELSFDMVNARGDHEKAWGSQVYLEGWNGDSWVYISNFGTNGMDDMAVGRLDLGAWEDAGPDPYTMAIPAFRGLYSKIRLVCESANYGAMMYIDNISMVTTPAAETVCVIEDEPVEGFEKTYDGLDMENRYLVGVKVKKGGIVSDERRHEPFGIATPKIMESADVDEDGFTANWERVSNAAAYLVTAYDCLVATEDVAGYMMADADMSGVSVGTTDYNKPEKLGNLEEYFDLTDYIDEGWFGAGVAAVDGAIGCRACGYMPGMYGIMSPELNLHNDGGRFTVKALVWGRAGSSLSVGCNRNVGSSEEFADDDEHEVTVTVEGGTKHDRLAFFSTDGAPFFIKNLQVIQNVGKGGYILQAVDTREVAGENTSAHVDFPAVEGRDRAYDVMAGRVEFTRNAVSDYSETMLVKVNVGVDEAYADNEAMLTVRGNCLVTTLFNEAVMSIYTVDGQTVNVVDCPVGTTVVTLPASGMYVVRVGDTVTKVLVR